MLNASASMLHHFHDLRLRNRVRLHHRGNTASKHSNKGKYLGNGLTEPFTAIADGCWHVEHRKSFGVEDSDELLNVALCVFGLDVLQGDVCVDEVEAVGRKSTEIVRLIVMVRHAIRNAVQFRGLAQHELRDVDAVDMAKMRREGKRQTADSTAKVQCPFSARR